MEDKHNYDFTMEWLNELLKNMENKLTDEQCAELLIPCSECHLKTMKPVIEQFKGNLQGFLDYTEKEWGQKVTYHQDKNEIIVDENKSFCVCPIADCMNGRKVSPALCNCSANMTAGMIAEVSGQKAKAQVVASVLRGDSSCIYRIELFE